MFVLKFIFLLFFPFTSIVGYSSYSEFQRGTLVLIIPCRDGILICADKRMYRPSVGIDDNFSKVIKLNNFNGYAIIGAPIVWRNKIKIFDVFDLLNEKLKEEAISDKDDFWNDLMYEVRIKFINTVLNAPYNDWPNSEYPQNNYILFQVIFFHTDDQKIPKMSLLQFRYIKNINPLVEINVYDLSVKGSFSAFGANHVIMELQNGNNKEFDILRNDPKLSKILKNQVLAQDLSLEDAIYFGKNMITYSHKMYKLVSDIDGHIGPTCDLFLFNKNGLEVIKE